jgi:hypothetical protein
MGIDYDKLAQQARQGSAVDYDKMAQDARVQAAAPRPLSGPIGSPSDSGVPEGLQGPASTSPVRDEILQNLAPIQGAKNHAVDLRPLNLPVAMAHGAAQMVLHPVDSVQAVAQALPNVSSNGYTGSAYTGNDQTDQDNADALVGSPNAQQSAIGTVKAFKEDPISTVGNLLGPALLMHGLFKGAPVAADGASRVLGSVGDMGLGNPDTSLRRAFAEGPKSSSVDQLLEDSGTVRHGLQGATSMEDVQNRIFGTPAKTDVTPGKRAILGQGTPEGPVEQGLLSKTIDPYNQGIQGLGDTPIGPNGETATELEKQRLDLSRQAQDLQGVDSQEAKQKLRDVLAQKKSVEGVLYPALQESGINAYDIMKNYGAYSRIGQELEGRSTRGLLTAGQGLGRIGAVLKNPIKLGTAVLTHGGSLIPEGLDMLREMASGRNSLGGTTLPDLEFRRGFQNPRGIVTPSPDFGSFKPSTEAQSPSEWLQSFVPKK